MEHLSESDSKKWSTFSKSAAKSDVPIKISVLRDIAVELQFDPETWRDDAEGKRLRYEAYVKRFMERFKESA